MLINCCKYVQAVLQCKQMITDMTVIHGKVYVCVERRLLFMQKKYVMALDAGTTSNRAIVFDNESHILGVSQKEY